MKARDKAFVASAFRTSADVMVPKSFVTMESLISGCSILRSVLATASSDPSVSVLRMMLSEEAVFFVRVDGRNDDGLARGEFYLFFNIFREVGKATDQIPDHGCVFEADDAHRSSGSASVTRCKAESRMRAHFAGITIFNDEKVVVP